MIEPHEITVLMKSVSTVVKDYFAWATSPIVTKLEELSRYVGDLEKAAKVPGPRGEKGESGPAGESIRGERGESGLSAFEIAQKNGAVSMFQQQEEDWVKSLQGTKGEKGEPGESIVGPVGPAGEAIKGDAGPAGVAGPKGDDGAPGQQGECGLPGHLGPQGPSGAQGERGEAGPIGAVGPIGKDAYQLAVEEGFSGSRAQWFESLRGKDAPTGRDGRDGKAGDDGAPGRDAADIQPLPAIDAAKKYPRGTWAKHAGGIWLSRSETDGMAGWDCVQEGLTPLVIETADNRNFTIKLQNSSGKIVELPFFVPSMLYRDVWREAEYQQGDTVTFGGSLFHCQRTTRDKPETSDAWKLCVKRGRDGKDKS